MPTTAELKSRVCQEIDSRGDEIIAVAKTIVQNPEPGFREHKTARLVAEKFVALGIPHRDHIAVTGVKGILSADMEGPTVAVLGELDSLIVPGHPDADPDTGAAHACGHNCQIATLIGVATGLIGAGVLPALAGRVAFMAVPAEEYIELEYRESLREQGEIAFLGGKPEFIRLGEFDDVDMAMMVHTASAIRGRLMGMGGTNNGCVAKQVQFIGRGSHAGGAPHAGINALNAAMIALSAIHAQRETFKDSDTVRVHPIITRGGQAVNIVPADVRLETFVRGKTLEAIRDASEKVDRALRAGALAVGGKARIKTLPGYLPIINDRNLGAVFRANAEALLGKRRVAPPGRHATGSTDMGDVSRIMPAIHPYAAGASGTGHGDDYIIRDYGQAVLNPARVMAMTVIDLLADGATRAKEVLARHKPDMTRREYLDLLESLRKDELYQG